MTFRPLPALPDDARWIRANEQVEFQGIAIRGGLFYVGSSTGSSGGRQHPAGLAGIEPSLVDPVLPISFPQGDSPAPDLPFWPSYVTLAPHERGVYLRWLAGGRREPAIPIGYPFLFLYGIERRLLHDRDRLDDNDLAAIRREFAALATRYGPASESFRAACEEMTGLADLLEVEHALAAWQHDDPGALHDAASFLPPPPPLLPDKRAIPIPLRIGLGVLALAHRPIPAAWALAWAWYEPATTIRTAAIRLPDEFAALFAIRYRERYGEGLVLDPAHLRRLDLRIVPANATLGEQQVPTRLPDVTATTGMSGLFDLIRIVTAELDPSSRWLGRNPGRAGSLAVLAMLPEVLIDPTSPALAGASAELADLLGEGAVAVVPGERVLRLWVGGRDPVPEKLARADGAALANALARLGYGIEPDPRAGIAVAAGAAVALFRLPAPAAPGEPEPMDLAMEQALLLIDLAAIVSEADGAASPPEFAAMRHHLHAAYALSPLDDARLGAHLAWLGTRPASERTLAGMKKRIAPRSPGERDRLATGLLRIVDADGTISPTEVAVLQKIWKLLGRDPDRVASDLHAVMTGGRLDPTPPTPTAKTARGRSPQPRPRSRVDAPQATATRSRTPAGDEPVVVRRGQAETPGVRIPPPPEAVPTRPEPDVADVALDPSAVARKIADTAAVSALLGDLLDEPPAPAEAPATSAAAPAPRTAAPERDLLAALDGADAWSAEDFAALAERHGMMPNAALDLLNDLGFEHAGDPLLVEEADGSLSVDAAALAIVREVGNVVG